MILRLPTRYGMLTALLLLAGACGSGASESAQPAAALIDGGVANAATDGGERAARTANPDSRGGSKPSVKFSLVIHTHQRDPIEANFSGNAVAGAGPGEFNGASSSGTTLLIKFTDYQSMDLSLSLPTSPSFPLPSQGSWMGMDEGRQKPGIGTLELRAGGFLYRSLGGGTVAIDECPTTMGTVVHGRLNGVKLYAMGVGAGLVSGKFSVSYLPSTSELHCK